MTLFSPLRRKALTVAAVLAVIATVAHGEDSAIARRHAPELLAGIGERDPRIMPDLNAAPWRGVGKLQATSGTLYTSCTGALIGPATVLTAAHCLLNPRTREFFPPSALHFLIGYDRGSAAGHAHVVSFVTSDSYDPAQPRKTRSHDWALLTLDTELGTPDRILPLLDRAPAVGTAVTIGGYSQDHPYVITADPDCRIVGREVDGGGHALLRHDCTATHGASGAPVLVLQNGVWRIAGIDVAAELGAASGLAALLEEARRRL